MAQAKTEERLEGLRAKHQQLARDLGQRQREQQQGQQVVASSRERRVVSQKAQLAGVGEPGPALPGQGSGPAPSGRAAGPARCPPSGSRPAWPSKLRPCATNGGPSRNMAHNCELKAKDLHHQRQSLIERSARGLSDRPGRAASPLVSPGEPPASAGGVSQRRSGGRRSGYRRNLSSTRSATFRRRQIKLPPLTRRGSLDAGGSQDARWSSRFSRREEC